MADRPVLACTEGPLVGQVFPVLEGGMEIGRSPDNDLVIDDDGVSRFHARLLYDNGSLWIRDAGSRNGVFVNDQRLGDHKALKVGDKVRIASTVFEIRWEDGRAGGKDPDDDKGGWRRWLWPFE
jgi:pSer/pThr/pTyr-binding forkhead associated (FHA) protein